MDGWFDWALTLIQNCNQPPSFFPSIPNPQEAVYHLHRLLPTLSFPIQNHSSSSFPSWKPEKTLFNNNCQLLFTWSTDFAQPRETLTHTSSSAPRSGSKLIVSPPWFAPLSESSPPLRFSTSARFVAWWRRCVGLLTAH